MIEIEKESSSHEVAKCLNFINTYIDKGGSISSVELENFKIHSDILKKYVVVSLAAYDEIHAYFMDNVPTRAHYEYCLHQLELQMAQSMVTGIATTEVLTFLEMFPGVEVLAALVSAGYDLASAVRMADDFNKCLNT